MRKKEYCTLLKLSHKHTHRWLKTDDSIYKYERKNNKKKSNPTFFLQIKYDRFFNALLNWLNLGVYPILIIQTFLFFVLILLTLLCDTHYYLDGWLSKLYLRDWLFTFCFLSPVENLKCISTLHDLAKFWIWETFKHTLIFFLK